MSFGENLKNSEKKTARRQSVGFEIWSQCSANFPLKMVSVRHPMWILQKIGKSTLSPIAFIDW